VQAIHTHFKPRYSHLQPRYYFHLQE